MSENESFICPHCGATSLLIESTYQERITSFKSDNPIYSATFSGEDIEESNDFRDTIRIGFSDALVVKITLSIFLVLALKLKGDLLDFSLKIVLKYIRSIFPSLLGMIMRKPVAS